MSFVAIDCARIAHSAKLRRNSFDKKLLLSVAAIALTTAPAAYANPLGGAVTTGSASISTSSNKTNVNQKSEDVVIDWSSFNIGNGQATQFVQPNAQAIAVNRVGGANATQILGTLDANGRVVLINGNGVLFGKGAQVNVGSLIATSTDGSDTDVLSGKFTQAGKQNASVINNGAITAASGGVVALVAPNVTNTGTVNAKLGTVALGAANKFTVDFTGDGLVSFAAQGDVSARASAINSGLLSGANVSMTAHAANGIATGIVNMSGIITAQGVQNVGGTIYLNAGNGTLTTTGTLNAAGATGGGRIETSGEAVNISGRVTGGKGGLWKVDPEDLTIDSTAAGTIDGTLAGGTSVVEQTTSGAASGTGNQTAGAGDITVASALSWNTTATLTLDSYHSININAPIAITGAGGLTLITNDNGGSGGSLNFNGNANVAFSDVAGSNTQGALSINGASYSLVNSVAQLASAVSGNPSGNFALANSYDATSDGTYSAAPVQTVLTGNFLGLGNSITNLTINDPTPSDDVGLFAQLGSGGAISYVHLSSDATTGAASADIGGLVGLDNGGAILGSSVAGTITGAADSDIGGLVGNSSSASTISNSYAAAAIVGSHNVIAGGLVGLNSATITNSYATGDVTTSHNSIIGGLLGDTFGNVTNSYETGTVTGTGSTVSGTGSIIGGLMGENSATVTGSYATGTVSAGPSSIVGGLLGDNFGPLGNSYSTSAVTVGASTTAGGLIGENFDTVASSYSMGAVSGGAGSTLGGLIGSDDSSAGSITNSYWNTDTSGISNPSQGDGDTANDPGITGLSSAQFTQASNFSGFSFGTNAGGSTCSSGGACWVIVDADNSLNNAGGAAGASFPMLLSEWSTNIVNPHQIELMALNPTASYTLGANVDFVTGPGNIVPGNINIIAPLSWSSADTLTLDSYQSVNVTAPVTISGAGALAIDTNDNGGSGGALSFDLGPSGFAGNVSYGATNFGGTLNINGANYTLLYSMSDVQSVNSNPNANYALATSINATGTSSWTPIGMNSGYTFEGLGNSISNLTVNMPSSTYVGLFGVTNGAVRDVGLVGASVTGADDVGGLAGENFGTIADSYVTGAVNSAGGDFVGGLVGNNGSPGSISGSYAADAVIDSGGSDVGGLAGRSSGPITNSYAIGAVTANGSSNDVGGLVGYLSSASVSGSFATGAVLGSDDVGGLVGYLINTNVSDSFASGAVSGAFAVGGLVGESEEGAIVNSYAMGAVNGNNGVGGLVGTLFDPSSSVTNSFSIGHVVGSANVGGLVGEESDSGGVTNSYWDWQTSGVMSDGAGAVKLTTGNMQGTFANMTGFAGLTWATGTGLFPYLAWQFASTPQVVSGFTVAPDGKTGVSGLGVSLLVNGTSVTPAIDMTSGANGYYYLLLAPGTISNSGSPIFAYVAGSAPGASYVANAIGSDGALEIVEDEQRYKSGASNLTGLVRGLLTATGGNFDLLFTVFGGEPNANFFLDDSAANFNVNSPIDTGTGTFWFYDPNGALSESGGGTITAGVLRGTTANGVTLNGANDIAHLGQFINTGSGGFSLTNSDELLVTGTVDAGTGDLSLTTTANSIVLAGDLTAGGTVSLTSGSAIWQNPKSSIITANTLTGSANGATNLQGANLITDLGAFDVNDANFYLTNDQTLTVTGTVRANVMSLETTHGDLIDNGELSGTTMNLTSLLGEVDGAGIVDAGVLNVTADTGIDLDGTSNTIKHVKTDTTNSGPNVINKGD